MEGRNVRWIAGFFGVFNAVSIIGIVSLCASDLVLGESRYCLAAEFPF
jgi:hypothetical protein